MNTSRRDKYKREREKKKRRQLVAKKKTYCGRLSDMFELNHKKK